MKLPRSIVADVVCERSIDAREDTVHDFEESEDKNEARGKLKLDKKIEISMHV